ncbi:hypothetical protein [Gemmatimonas sp.]|uniref:hypothetical protein n=1 Tax=Gemmatimonas sp. TaxID=1962908 RepID=UPI0037C09CE7
MRAEFAVRDALVRTRTRSIALAKALVRRDGLRVPRSASAWVPTRIAELDLSPTLTTELAPLFAVFAPLNAQIAGADARIAAFAKAAGRSRVDDPAIEVPEHRRAARVDRARSRSGAPSPSSPRTRGRRIEIVPFNNATCRGCPWPLR